MAITGSARPDDSSPLWSGLVHPLLLLAVFPPLSAQVSVEARRFIEVSPTRFGVERIRDIDILPDSTVAIIGTGRDIVTMFDRDGSRLGAVGRGSFSQFSGIPGSGTHQNSIWVRIPGMSDIHHFDSRGRPVGTESHGVSLLLADGDPAPVVQPGGMMGPIVQGWPSDGVWIMTVFVPVGSPVPAEWQRPDGATRAMVAVLSNGVIRNLIRWEEGASECRFRGALLPYCLRSVHINSDDGSRFGQVRLMPETESDSLQFLVKAVSAKGDVLYDRTFSVLGSALERAKLDSALGRITSSTRLGLSVTTADSLLTAYTPRMYPVVEGGFFSTDGALWLRTGGVSDREQYLVVSGNGDLQSIVTLPVGVRGMAAYGSMVWGVTAAGYGGEGSLTGHRF